MKITDVRVLRMAAPGDASTNWLFVKIETDSGIYGVGEGSLQYKDVGLTAEIEDFKKFLIGKDPFQIEHIWTSLYRRVTWAGGPVTMSAISAIDLALWDIKGKALDVPVYELIGGKVRDRVRVYANGWFGGLNTPEDHAEAASKLVGQGYTALKFYPFTGEQVVTPERIERGVSLVRAVREAVGPNVEIAIDIRARLNVWSAMRVAQQLEPFNIAWMEEPVMFDNVEALAALARKVNVPISTGEQLYNRWQFQPLLEQNAVGDADLSQIVQEPRNEPPVDPRPTAILVLPGVLRDRMGVVHELDEGLVSHLKGVIEEPEGPVMVVVLACRKVPDRDGEPEEHPLDEVLEIQPSGRPQTGEDTLPERVAGRRR